MLKWFLALKFLKPYQIFANEEANRLHLLYLFGLGGLITDRTVSCRVKLMYALYITITFIVLFVPSIMYIYEQLRGASNTLQIELILSALISAATITAVIGIDLLTFICRKNLIHGIKTMSIDFGIEGTISRIPDLFDQVAYIIEKKFNVWHWFSTMSGLFFFWMISAGCFRYVSHFFLLDRTTAYNNFYYWVFPVWKMEENESYAVYSAITIVHASLGGLTAIKRALYILFFFWSGEILANHLIQVACILETESSHARILLQSIDTKLLSGEISRSTAQIMKNRISQEIIGNGVRFIQNYRKLRKAIGDWKTYLEISFVFTTVSNFIFVSTTVFQILQDYVPVPFKIAFSGFLIPLLGSSYACCHFGKVLDDAVDILNVTLYNTPWYQLSPAERKVIHLMMCELQQSPIKFTSFQIYPLTTETFPRIVKADYAIVNIIAIVKK